MVTFPQILKKILIDKSDKMLYAVLERIIHTIHAARVIQQYSFFLQLVQQISGWISESVTGSELCQSVSVRKNYERTKVYEKVKYCSFFRRLFF